MTVKRFLIGFTIVYVTIGLGLNIAFGPPAFTSEFQEKYRAEIDRYFATIKSPAYKLWLENPELHPPDAALTAQISFVDSFTQNTEYKAEAARRSTYASATDWFNVTMVVVLVVGLARGPVGRMVDGMVAAERDRIESIERDRASAARRKSDAERKLEQLDDERSKVNRQIQARIDDELRRVEADSAIAFEHLRREWEDRTRQEWLLAERRLKAEMVDAAIAELSKRYAHSAGSRADMVLLDLFLADLKVRS